MKYLTTYRLFENKESIDDIQQTIMDVFDDLRDEGYECYCNVGYGQYPSVEIRIYKNDHLDSLYNELPPEFVERHPYSFQFKDIEGVMRRIYNILMEWCDVDVDFNFVINLEKEFSFSLAEHGFEILEKEFPNYYDKFDRGFIIYFDIK